MSINLALDIAMQSLRTYSAAIDVTDHNIANMNDPYYSRQIANISATTPIDNIGGAGQIGTGSQISAIERIRDLFLDTQIQTEMSNVGEYTELNRTNQLLSALIPEVNGSTDGLQSKMDAFFADWQKLADAAATGVQADIDSAKAILYSDSVAFTTSMNSTAGDMKNIQLGLTTDIQTTVSNINDLVQQIYEFNKEIKYAESIGQRPNDMLDKQNEAVTQLAELTNIDTRTKDDGTVVVSINGHALVNGADGYNKLTTIAGNADARMEDVAFESDLNTSINKYITGGELGGLLQSRDQVIKPYLDQLNDLASSLVASVNKIHEAGDPGQTDFFLGFKADTIMVNPALQDPTKINVSMFGTNDIADMIANLNNKVINNYISSPSLPYTAATQLRTILGMAPGDPDVNGTLLINSVPIQYNTSDTLATLVNKINNNVTNFSIVYNQQTNQFFMVGNDLFTIQEQSTTTNSLLDKLGWFQETDSAAPVNSAPSPTIGQPNLFQAWNARIPANPALPPTYEAKYLLNTAADTGAYPNGILDINYNNTTYAANWTPAQRINVTIGGISAATGLAVQTDYNVNTQKFRAYSITNLAPATPGVRAELLPFTFSDKQGNMTQVLNLPGETRFGSIYQTIVGQVTGQLSSGQSLLNGYQAALTQYQNMQTQITQVNSDQELATANMYQRAYDASVKLMDVVDEMMNLLINGTGTASSSSSTTSST